MSFKFTSNFDEASKLIAENRISALNEIGEELSSQIKKAAPVDTGRLRDSIEYHVDQEGLVIGTDVDYAISIELGSSKRLAEPFINNTVNENLVKVKSVTEKNMSKV